MDINDTLLIDHVYWPVDYSPVQSVLVAGCAMRERRSLASRVPAYASSTVVGSASAACERDYGGCKVVAAFGPSVRRSSVQATKDVLIPYVNGGRQRRVHANGEGRHRVVVRPSSWSSGVSACATSFTSARGGVLPSSVQPCALAREALCLVKTEDRLIRAALCRTDYILRNDPGVQIDHHRFLETNLCTALKIESKQKYILPHTTTCK
jgi:hypothetical protein